MKTNVMLASLLLLTALAPLAAADASSPLCATTYVRDLTWDVEAYYDHLYYDPITVVGLTSSTLGFAFAVVGATLTLADCTISAPSE